MAAPEKPEIAREARLVAPDDWPRRGRAKLAAWMVKLLASAATLLVLWLVLATLHAAPGCSGSAGTCANSPTAWFLAAAAVATLWLRVLLGQPAPREADPPLPKGLEVHESRAYQALSKAAITLNKLWICALVLLVFWLPVGALGHQQGCSTPAPAGAPTQPLAPDAPAPGPDVAAAAHGFCSVLLSPASVFLAETAIVSFALQIVLGLAGTVVGRRIVEMAPSQDEVGARRETPRP